MTVWLNGALLAAEAARIDPRDRGLLLGDGLFETLPLRTGRAVWLDRHLARLRAGAALLRIPVPWDDAAVAAAIDGIAAADGLADAALRITLTRGPAPRGLLPPPEPRPTLLVTAGPLPPPAGPVAAIVATVTRRNEASPLSRLKSLNYLDAVLARQEAAERGAAEALLLNTQGRLAETTIANVFVLRDGVLATPPVVDGALPGIMRAALIERCGAVERPLSPADLAAAQAAFACNSLGLRPIATVDGTAIGGSLDAAAALVGKCLAALPPGAT